VASRLQASNYGFRLAVVDRLPLFRGVTTGLTGLTGLTVYLKSFSYKVEMNVQQTKNF
jgi:hypothetical protein